jgi:hypothetical protein
LSVDLNSTIHEGWIQTFADAYLLLHERGESCMRRGNVHAIACFGK